VLRAAQLVRRHLGAAGDVGLLGLLAELAGGEVVGAAGRR
jgi:hypothetical protein